jgi:hypothetical protein
MDFIVKLPLSKDPLTGTAFDSILVVNDRLTKFARLIPYKEASNAEALAYAFMKEVVANHGTPDEIITDRGTVLTSQFWQSLMDLLGTKHKLSTSYHPQTDGQTERTNQTIEQYLRCYLNYEQDNWVTLLPIAQFAFNNSIAVTGISPFYANYGVHPKISSESLNRRAQGEASCVRLCLQRTPACSPAYACPCARLCLQRTPAPCARLCLASVRLLLAHACASAYACVLAHACASSVRLLLARACAPLRTPGAPLCTPVLPCARLCSLAPRLCWREPQGHSSQSIPSFRVDFQDPQQCRA